MRNGLTSKILLALGQKGALRHSQLLFLISKENTSYQNTKLLSRRVYQTLHYLNSNGMVKISGNGQIALTRAGAQRLARLGPAIEIKKNKVWDKFFRIVAFDIPLAHRKKAEAFRRMLKELKFLQLQRSLWVYPYECEREIMQIAHHHGLEAYITIMVVEKISNYNSLKKAFGLH
jgi:DNA-binding transcriptional regulator PaaX